MHEGPLHVLILPSFYPDDDNPYAGIFFKEQAVALQQYGVKVGVAFVELRRLKKVTVNRLWQSHFQSVVSKEEGVYTIRLKSWNTLVRTKIGALIWVRLTQWLVDEYIRNFGQPDLIHAHCTFWAGYAAQKASQRYHIPFVLTEHSSMFMKDLPASYSQIAKKVISLADKVVAVSSGLACRLSAYTGTKRISVIANMVDTEYFYISPIGHEKDSFRFLYIGSLDSNKACDLLITAFSEAFESEKHVYLDIIGKGKLEHQLQVLVQSLSVKDQIKFFGSCTREQIRDKIWFANCLVSTSYIETFGVVLIEALSTGIPVIATRSGGPEDIVTEKTGILIDKGDFNSLVFALKKMKNEYACYQPNQIRQDIIQRFGRHATSKQITRLYQDIVGKSTD